MGVDDILRFASPDDVLRALCGWLRAERQRLCWTQAELARRSGVPAATISRLELTGLGSTEAIMKILFAMDRLEPMADFLKERQRLAAIPVSLNEPIRTKPVLRVRKKKVRI